MAKIIANHSIRSGYGVSTISVNLAAQLAAWGNRVCLIDMNISSPSVLYLTNTSVDKIKCGVDDFLMGQCEIEDVLFEIPPERFGNRDGSFFIAPSRMYGRNVNWFIKHGVDFNLLNDMIQVIAMRNFDHIILDLPSGLTENNLLFITAADILLAVSNPHVPNLNSLAALIDIANTLDVPTTLILVNMAIPRYNADEIMKEYEKKLERQVTAILPANLDIVDFYITENKDFFVLAYPDHPFSQELARCASML